MATESATYIDGLDAAKPALDEDVSDGDDHIRLIKSTVKATFPNLTGAVTPDQAELNILNGATLSTAELNILDNCTATTAELNLVDGSVAGTIVNSKAVVYGASGEVNATTLQIGGNAITATAAELNKTDGVVGALVAMPTTWNSLTGNAAATANQGYYNATTGNHTLTLPASPAVGDHVWIVNVLNGRITVARNGNNLNGADADFSATDQVRGVLMVYTGNATVGWFFTRN